MNKASLFALLALVAACAAAPQGFSPIEEAPVVDLPDHEETKRAILYRAPVQYRILSGLEYPGYEYPGLEYPGFEYPAYYRSAYSYPYYGRYAI